MNASCTKGRGQNDQSLEKNLMTYSPVSEESSVVISIQIWANLFFTPPKITIGEKEKISTNDCRKITAKVK